MKIQDFSWQAFKETGDIDAYLLYKELSKQRDEEWTATKHGDSLQGGQITENQTVC